MSDIFSRTAATDARLLRRSCESLIGLCNGMLVDGNLSDDEVIYLKNWLEENNELAYTWPGEVLYKRINQVLADSVITEDERNYLTKTLEDLTGNELQETGATSSTATSLPVQPIESVEFDGRTFCFTGTFLFGTRASCHRAIQKNGGIPAPRITKKLDKETLIRLNGELVIAGDENGGVYFKRLRCHGDIVALESANSSATTSSELVALADGASYPKLTVLKSVIGVLFELPGQT